MTNTFTYKNHNFNMQVLPYNRLDLDGIWYTIITNCTDHDNYYSRVRVRGEELGKSIGVAEQDAKKYIDNKLNK